MKPAASKPGIMHVVDTLDAGGLETVAVNLVNRIPRDVFRPFICTTRPAAFGDALAAALDPEVPRLKLNRKGRFDPGAIYRLLQYIRQNDIRLLHAHGTSLFIGRLMSLLSPLRSVQVIWHDHYGRCELNDRPVPLYRMATAGAGGVIAVNHRLAEWARRDLGVPSRRIWYVPNFVDPRSSDRLAADPPGVPGCRIVCVANLRPQKDHLTLLRAMALVVRSHPRAHLLIAGAPLDAEYSAKVRALVTELNLSGCVSLLGSVNDVGSLLRACDVGVLSSVSEGLPLSLLEYGWAGIPAVATNVGQCSEVLDRGAAGILVEPQAPEQLADGIKLLLGSAQRRAEAGRKLNEYVRATFDPQEIMDKICQIYETVLWNSAA